MIENRLAGYSYGHDDKNSVTIAVSTSDVAAASTGVSLTTLSDRGQAAMINQTKGKPPATIKPDDSPNSSVTTRNTLSRHMVIAVRPSGFLAPGDRVDAIQVSIKVAQPSTSKWQITSWTQASNGETVIDLGKSTDTSTSKATISAGINVAKFLPSLTVGGENDQTNQREVEIKDTTDFDASVDNSGQAWLYETAGWRQSLAHNLSLDVVLTAPTNDLRPEQVVSLGKLVVDDPKHKGSTKPAKASDVRLVEGSVYSPLDYETAPICGWATLTYRIRHVTNGGYTTFSESDDVVQLRTGTAATSFLLAPPPYAPSYVIKEGSHSLSYQTVNRKPLAMIFASAADATAFRNWLNQVAPPQGRLANVVIGFDLAGTIRPLNPTEIKNLNPQIESPAWAKSTDWFNACEAIDARALSALKNDGATPSGPTRHVSSAS